MIQYWWVNQNQTHKQEIDGGFLWSPKRKKGGQTNHFYENMRMAQRGDIVFSYYKTLIQAVGVVTTPAEDCPKPDFGSAGADWSEEGWLVGVEFTPVPIPAHPKSYITAIRPLLRDKYAPLTKQGDGLQGVYLAEIDPPLAAMLLNLTGAQALDLSPVDDGDDSQNTAADLSALEVIEKNTDIGPAERLQLVKARRGQGIFRNNVRIHEQRCRVTGTQNVVHLRASHIKPWRDASNTEKLNGFNGLLLAPHVDHLFDRGWISFSDEGGLLLAKNLNREVLDEWSIDPDHDAGPFHPEQSNFLEYHRKKVFQTN